MLIQTQPPAAPRLSPRLLGLNVALLAVLGGITLLSLTGSVQGQPDAAGAGGRGRGDYTIVSGRVQGMTASALYVLDAANQEIVAIGWNRNANQIEPIGYRSLSDDAKFLQRPR